MSARTFGRSVSRIMDSSAVQQCRALRDVRPVSSHEAALSGMFVCTSVFSVRLKFIFYVYTTYSYSGKTQKQIIEFVRENYVKRQNFQR